MDRLEGQPNQPLISWSAGNTECVNMIFNFDKNYVLFVCLAQRICNIYDFINDFMMLNVI